MIRRRRRRRRREGGYIYESNILTGRCEISSPGILKRLEASRNFQKVLQRTFLGSREIENGICC